MMDGCDASPNASCFAGTQNVGQSLSTAAILGWTSWMPKPSSLRGGSSLDSPVCVLGENDNFRVERLEKRHLEQGAEVLARAFVHKNKLEITKNEEEWKVFGRGFLSMSLHQSMGSVIIDKTSGRVAGVAAFRDWAIEDESIADQFDVIDRLLEAVGSKFREENAHLKPGECAHIDLLATDDGYDVKGTFAWHLSLVLKYLKRQGFAQAVGETTNPISLAVAKKAGFKVYNMLRARDFDPIFEKLGDYEVSFVVNDLSMYSKL